MTITAAADGSALGNPGPAGWAWYIDEQTWRAGGWPHGTNNMGELKAVLDLLEATAVDADQHLHVLCDSQYVINSVTKWMPGWKRKGWRKKDGKPVMNVDLLKAIDRALAGRSVEFEWVKGHAGHAMNEAADRRANAAAVSFSKKQDPDVGPGYRAGEEAPPQAPSADAARSDQSADADLFSLFDAERTSGASEPFEEIVAREQTLLSDLLRKNPQRARALLHPDFSEIGSSGAEYDLEQMLSALAPLPGLQAREFIADEVAPDVVLLRYLTTDRRGSSRRSSLWVRHDGQWLLRHHQGTPSR